MRYLFRRLLGITPPFGYEIETKTHKENVPKFKKTYSAQITKEVTVDLDFENKSYSGRMSSLGKLTQKNGHHIFFSPNNVAREILDKALVPLVEAFVENAKYHDRIFMDSRPNEFVDEKGVTWRKL